MRLLAIFGIDFRLNIFFLILFLVYWYFGFLVQALVIFTVVFLHEMGHVVVAVGYGVRVREVELLPFGGVARVEGNIELNPAVETYIAMAGPITNAFLAVIGYIFYRCGVGNQQWLPFFVQCNLILGVFNLLPGIPLDGGRMFRAFASLRLGLKKATARAVTISYCISTGMALVGLWSVFGNGGENFNLLVLAIFLTYAATKEKGSVMYVFMKFLTRKKEELFREGILLIRPLVALESSPLKEIVKFFVPKKYHLVTVVGKDQQIRGTLTEGEVIEAMLRAGPNTPVGYLVREKK